MGRRTVFPAAAEPDRAGGHDRNCACDGCTARLLEVIRKPLVPGGPSDRRSGK